MLTAGSLGDRWGARRVYQTGTALFAMASAVCATAPDPAVLIAARAVQGVGAAAVVPCSLALIAHRFPEGHARSRALGIWGGVSGIGLTAGPVLGGWLVGALGWRSVFLVVVPVAVVSMILVATRIDESSRQTTSRPDLVGQPLAIIALTSLTAALTMTSVLGWHTPLVLGLLGTGVLAGVAFVIGEHRVAEPMLPPALFTAKAFSGATGIGLLFNFGLYGVLFCLAIFLERTLHATTAITGVVLLPLTGVTALGALASGRVSNRSGPRVPMVIGLSGGLLSCCLLAVWGDRSGPLALAGFGAVLGCVGLAMPTMTGVALTAAGRGRAGLGAATLNAARQAGGALGVALLGSTALQQPSVQSATTSLPHLRFPMIVASAGYLLAIIITVAAIGGSRRDAAPS
jgi:DHA2 family methylenomycin A resistance protein-like MFS transporter